MKILQVTEAASAGVGRHVLDLSMGLLKKECEVHLIYSPRRIDNTFATAMQQPGKLQCTAIDMRRSPHPSDISVLQKIRRYIRRHGPFDIIHAQSTKAGILMRLNGYEKQTRVVYTPHCIYTMNPTLGKSSHIIAKLAELALAQRTDSMVAVSPEEESHLLELGFARERVRYISNGIYPQNWPDRDSLRKALKVQEEEVLIGFLGRFSLQKNPLMMIEAFAKLAPLYPQTVLAMAGDGPLIAEAKALAKSFGLGERIRWLGYRFPGEFLPALDIFALSSNYEALPYVLLEALCAGLPIVSTNVGGVSLTLEHGHNGLIVPSFDAGDFSKALGMLIGVPELRQRMGQASRLKAQGFRTDSMIDETYQLYLDLLNTRSRTIPVAT
ncbi:MAG: glycosyltransferase [Chromatiales bacterium]|jgi:glycosyltransferase involved in cell wall biosynthesis